MIHEKVMTFFFFFPIYVLAEQDICVLCFRNCYYYVLNPVFVSIKDSSIFELLSQIQDHFEL